MYSRADSSSRIIDFDRNHSLAKLNRHIYIYKNKQCTACWSIVRYKRLLFVNTVAIAGY